jgi:hypothetical protein
LVNVGLQCKNATPIDKDVIVWSKYHKPVN